MMEFTYAASRTFAAASADKNPLSPSLMAGTLSHKAVFPVFFIVPFGG